MEKKKLTRNEVIIRILKCGLIAVGLFLVGAIVRLLILYTPLPSYIGSQYENQQYSEYIYADGKVGELLLNKTEKALANIPEQFLRMFLNDGGQVIVTRNFDELYQKYGGEDAGFLKYTYGFFVLAEKKIYLKPVLSSTQWEVLGHEFGHYLDRKCKDISHSSSFINTYLEEKESFQKIDSNKHHTSASNEYFAEAFVLYFSEPEKLRENCPGTYASLDRLLLILGNSPEVVEMAEEAN